jgi:TRAP-type C4-dicarboxylate transport system permease small subunit
MVLRTIWEPVKGTFELMGFAGAIVTAFAMAATQQGQGHIAVTFLKDRFSPVVEKLLVAISLVASATLFTVITWQSWRWAGSLLASGEVSETLHFIYYPFAFAVALGFGALMLSLITDLCLLLCCPGVPHR